MKAADSQKRIPYKEELIYELMHEAKLTKAQAKKSIESLFSVLADAADRGETIDLPEFLIKTGISDQPYSDIDM